LSLGNTMGSPVASDQTISGSSVVYFVASGATNVTLPAGTAGQQLILLNSNQLTGSSYTVKAPMSGTIYDGAIEIGTQNNTATIVTNAVMVALGSNNWLIIVAN
jgi:hypothetical protein